MSLGTWGKEKKNLKLSICNMTLRVGSKDSMQNNYSDIVGRVYLWAKNEQLTIKDCALWIPRQFRNLIICSHSKEKIIS